MTETQQRFLRAIGERVPMEHVVELHLFPPIRQGGVETGVAVVAEQTRHPEVAQAGANGAPSPENGVVDTSGDVEAAAVSDDAPPVEAEAAPNDSQSDAIDVEAGVDAVVDVVPEPSAADVKAAAGLAANAARVATRLTVHTARYRLTLKGADRGKWEVDVVAEADAPLEAVDAVIRGVQRRAGEGAEPDRLSTEALREALDAPLASLER